MNGNAAILTLETISFFCPASEAAREQGVSTAHLRIIDADYHGGAKAVCMAKNKADCEWRAEASRLPVVSPLPDRDGRRRDWLYSRGEMPIV